MKTLLVMNPGSTSTKLGIYEDDTQVLVKTLRHSSEELKGYRRVADQFQFRLDAILGVLAAEGFDVARLDAVVGRGGVIKPIPSGTYAVNQAMIDDIQKAERGEHASNLGAMLAREIGARQDIPAYIVDPVVVDELSDIARLSGLPEIQRISIFHALNQKAIARRYARDIGRKYDELNLIVAHLGGGISVGAHAQGKVIDVNNALNGEGPFSPERAGGLPVGSLIRECYSGKYTEAEMIRRLVGSGGVVAYLGTNDMMEVERRVESGDEEARTVYEGMAYQTAKEIAACSAVLKGRVDQILLTGGIVYSKPIVDWIRERVEFIAPVSLYPGEDELLALAEGALRVLKGEEEVREY